MYNDDLSGVSLMQLTDADNWQAKYRLITDWGKLITEKPEIRTDLYAIKGCETAAWMAHECIDDRHRFAFDSDSRVIKGLAVLLLSIIHNRTSAELSHLNLTVLLREAGLDKHMTPSRNNGFRAMIVRACELAKVPCELHGL